MNPITLKDVQRKSGIRDPAKSEDLQALIDESLPVVQGKLLPIDEKDEGAAATVRLGILLVLAGLALKEFANDEDQDDISIGPMKFGETRQSGTRHQRGQAMEADGWVMLKPFLKWDGKESFSFEVM